MTTVLVDTSIWVEHLRHGHSRLAGLLMDGEVATHSLIIGELACGNIKNRSEVLSLLKSLPEAVSVEHDEILYFIENHQLMGLGLGLIDVHLLASASLSSMSLLTADHSLNHTAERLKIACKQ